MKMIKELKDKHIVIVGAGLSIKTYWDKIENFIKKDNNIVTIGCNNINHIFTPNYHVWGSPERWRTFGHSINKNSKFVFRGNFNKKIIREKWSGSYVIIDNIEGIWEKGFEDKKSKQFKKCQVKYKNGVIHGCFKHVGSLLIFWSYIQGASKISIVGNDGYTLYSKENLDNKEACQHCYGKGHTDGFTYEYCLKRDMDRYRTLRLLKEYATKHYNFNFEFITPTVFNEFYNPNVLNIKDEYKWKEPTFEKYKYLDKYCMKNRKLSSN